MPRNKCDSQVDLYRFERLAWRRCYDRVAGVDEVGRGPLAGPVVAAAVVLPAPCPALPLADSKTLSARQREELAEAVAGIEGVQIGIGVVSPGEIDRINIRQATHAAMRAAILQLDPVPQFALVDGLAVPDFPVPSEFIVRGDARSASIAAASIIAKVHRDRLMSALACDYPGYGFSRHKGYATAEHLAALRELGPSPIHRRSFGPVRRAEAGAPVQMEFALHQDDVTTPAPTLPETSE